MLRTSSKSRKRPVYSSAERPFLLLCHCEERHGGVCKMGRGLQNGVMSLTSNAKLDSVSTVGLGCRCCAVRWQGGALRRQLQLIARDSAGQIAAAKQVQMNDKSGGEKNGGCEAAGLR